MTKSEAGILRSLLQGYGPTMFHNSQAHMTSAAHSLQKEGLVSLTEHDSLAGVYTVEFLPASEVPFE